MISAPKLSNAQPRIIATPNDPDKAIVKAPAKHRVIDNAFKPFPKEQSLVGGNFGALTGMNSDFTEYDDCPEPEALIV